SWQVGDDTFSVPAEVQNISGGGVTVQTDVTPPWNQAIWLSLGPVGEEAGPHESPAKGGFAHAPGLEHMRGRDDGNRRARGTVEHRTLHGTVAVTASRSIGWTRSRSLSYRTSRNCLNARARKAMPSALWGCSALTNQAMRCAGRAGCDHLSLPDSR